MSFARVASLPWPKDGPRMSERRRSRFCDRLPSRTKTKLRCGRMRSARPFGASREGCRARARRSALAVLRSFASVAELRVSVWETCRSYFFAAADASEADDVRGNAISALHNLVSTEELRVECGRAKRVGRVSLVPPPHRVKEKIFGVRQSPRWTNSRETYMFEC